MHFEFQNFREFGWYQYVITLEDAVTLKQNQKKMRFTGSFIIIENPCMEQLTQKYCRIWVLLSRLYLDYIQDVTSTSKDITPKMFKAFALQP